jgi:NAD(P)-dependent dehydrogenase (short-subunit alcohol dehydrogenase family)
MSRRLENKVAIVTGGGTGIGEAICKKFATEGAKVIVAGMPDDPVQDVVDEIVKQGGEALAFTGDLSMEENAKACVDKAISTYGWLNILINNAGVFPETNELQDFTMEGFQSLLKNNIQTAFVMSKVALPYLQETKGCIVSAGSEAGFQGLAMNAPYGGTKGFMHSFMLGLAVEQAKYGVRCNCVCPGAIDTAWTHKETGPMDSKMEKNIVIATPLGRRGTTEEVANVYLFLASDEASFVTGSLYPVDGGIVAAKGAVGNEAKDGVKHEPKGELRVKHAREGKPERVS